MTYGFKRLPCWFRADNRSVTQLNKEVSELESLIETKVSPNDAALNSCRQ